MDSGSMTNWIARDLLSNILYKTKGHTLLEVITMTGRERKKFELVEVFYNGKDSVNSLICYVYDGFTKHITVQGMPRFLLSQDVLSQEQYQQIVDPASTNIDHESLSLGIGIILCPASINKIRNGTMIHLDKLNINLEPTIFGIAISGEVPSSLKANINTIGTQCTAVVQVNSHVDVPKLVQKVVEPLYRTEFQRDVKSNFSSFGKVSEKNIYGDAKWLALGFSLIFMFVNMALGGRNFIGQHTLLSLRLLSYGFAIKISYGVYALTDILAVYTLKATFFLAWLAKDKQRMYDHEHDFPWFTKIKSL